MTYYPTIKSIYSVQTFDIFHFSTDLSKEIYMIHQYKFGDYNIVLYLCSGAVHIVDDVAYDIIEIFEQKTLMKSSL